MLWDPGRCLMRSRGLRSSPATATRVLASGGPRGPTAAGRRCEGGWVIGREPRHCRVSWRSLFVVVRVSAFAMRPLGVFVYSPQAGSRRGMCDCMREIVSTVPPVALSLSWRPDVSSTLRDRSQTIYRYNSELLVNSALVTNQKPPGFTRDGRNGSNVDVACAAALCAAGATDSCSTLRGPGKGHTYRCRVRMGHEHIIKAHMAQQCGAECHPTTAPCNA